MTSADSTPAKGRRGRGEGSLYWDEKRQRFVAEATVGYTPAGKRIVRRGIGKTKTDARNRLRAAIRDYEAGLAPTSPTATVAAVVADWLEFGLGKAKPGTQANYTILANKHIIPHLGARKLRELTATEVDRWLKMLAADYATRTLRLLHSILSRAVKRAMARDLVGRNVVDLAEVPEGTSGRPSQSLTFEQAKALMAAAEGSRLSAYIVVSLLTGARTEELRPLTWDHVDLDGQGDAVPPSIEVWHSVRAGGDTKTRKSRRTLALPRRCVEAFRAHRRQQADDRMAAGVLWEESGLVFTSLYGTELDHHNVLRTFRKVAEVAGLDAARWTPRELRHSFVSLLSDSGVPIEQIADLCGHAGTSVTESVYRHQLRPVLLTGAVAMDKIFDGQANDQERG